VAQYASKVVYYGGYPGSSGKPVAGRLSWRNDVLRFEPRDATGPTYEFDRARLRGVRRDEEGMTGARRVRLLIGVESDDAGTATLKFEMGGILSKAHKLERWLETLTPVCRPRKDNDV
jgi:hypothetical protein